MTWEYLMVLALVIIVPLIRSRDPSLSLIQNARALRKTLLTVCVPFLIWDMIATKRGHWSFNPNFTLGIYLSNLPIEEWMFFAVVVFVSVFVWESTKYFARKGK